MAARETSIRHPDHRGNGKADPDACAKSRENSGMCPRSRCREVLETPVLAIPAGLEPATRGVEIRIIANEISFLFDWCCAAVVSVLAHRRCEYSCRQSVILVSYGPRGDGLDRHGAVRASQLIVMPWKSGCCPDLRRRGQCELVGSLTSLSG